MPIIVTCPGCGRRLKAKDSLAGKQVPCPNCRQQLVVPESEEEASVYVLQTEAAAPDSPPPAPSPPEATTEEAPTDLHSPTRRPKKAVQSLPPLSVNEPPLWLRHFHWLLVLAMLPLAFSLLQKDNRDVEMRLMETISQLTPEQQEAVERLSRSENKESLDALFAVLPGQKIIGAYLPRKSLGHWILAVGAAVLFMGFFLIL